MTGLNVIFFSVNTLKLGLLVARLYSQPILLNWFQVVFSNTKQRLEDLLASLYTKSGERKCFVMRSHNQSCVVRDYLVTKQAPIKIILWHAT